MNTMATKDNKRIFYPGYFYCVTTNNEVIYSSKSIEECRQTGIDDDMILVCLPLKAPVKSTNTLKTITKLPSKAKKIVVDFIKNVLTIEGESVKILDKEYVAGTDTFDPAKWIEVVQACNKNAEVVEFIGQPIVPDGKDITNEMSDL